MLRNDSRTPASLAELQGESIMLFDDGGFKDGDWDSFLAIDHSRKEDSPRDTGSFGVGSRSYFHYSDVTLHLPLQISDSPHPLFISNGH